STRITPRMKIPIALASLFIVLSGRAVAIPQQVGGFLGMVGMPFEQFAMAREVWTPGAELKGKWQPRAGQAGAADGVETLDLVTDAEVFGIAAEQVSVELAGSAIRGIQVRYDEGKMKKGGHANAGDLFARVSANLRAVAGEPQAKSARGELTFRHD